MKQYTGQSLVIDASIAGLVACNTTFRGIVMWEYFSIGGVRFALDTLKGSWRWFRGRKRRLTPEEKLKARDQWRPLFEQQYRDLCRERLNMSVIIRDIKRMDVYPGTEEKRKGLHAWFKVEFADTYERGFKVITRVGELVENEKTQKWRWAKLGERGTTFFLVGFIPYENVVSVNWDGENFYLSPHVFCHFDGLQGQPYERLAYCSHFELNGFPHYSEIFSAEEIRKESKKHKVPYFA